MAAACAGEAVQTPTVRIQPLAPGAAFANTCEPSKRAQLIYEDGVNPPVTEQVCQTQTLQAEVFIDGIGKPYVLRQDSFADGSSRRADHLYVLRPGSRGLVELARLDLRTSPETPPGKVRDFWSARNRATGEFEIAMTVADKRGQPTTDISRVWLLPSAKVPESSSSHPSRITVEVRPLRRNKSLVLEPCGTADPVALSVRLNGHSFATWMDCSARGERKADTFTDNTNRTYVAFFRGPRGNAVYRELQLFQVEGSRLRPILGTALDYPLDGGTEHETDVTSASAAGGLKLTLRARTWTTGSDSDRPEPRHEDPSRGPEERTRSIWINPDTP